MKKIYIQYFIIAFVIGVLLFSDKSGTVKNMMLYICFFTGLWNFLLKINGKE